MITLTLTTKLLIVYLMFLLKTYIPILLSKNKRLEQQTKNIKLNELRQIKKKTLAQQKEFLDYKYPKKEPFKWSIIGILKAIPRIALFIGMYFLIKYAWVHYIGFNIKIWQLIIIMLILPILINTILKKINLQQDDVRIFLK